MSSLLSYLDAFFDRMDTPNTPNNDEYERRFKSLKQDVIIQWKENSEKLVCWLYKEASLADLLHVQKLCRDSNGFQALFEERKRTEAHCEYH